MVLVEARSFCLFAFKKEWKNRFGFLKVKFEKNFMKIVRVDFEGKKIVLFFLRYTF